MHLSQNTILDHSDVGGGDPGDHNRVVRVLKFFAHIHGVDLNRFPTTNFEFPILTPVVHVLSSCSKKSLKFYGNLETSKKKLIQKSELIRALCNKFD